MTTTILLTGFGPFRDHVINTSWEAIKDGKIKNNFPNKNINIIAEQISVSYKEVDDKLTNLCKSIKPRLIINIGLSYNETSISIETKARNGPYLHDDVEKFTPHENLREYSHGGSCLEEGVIVSNYTCKPCEFESCSTNINVDKICDKMNDLYKNGILKIPTRKSENAGLYLCEYIYSNSLKLCERELLGTKCLFIHVPSHEKFNLDDITACIQQVVDLLIDQES